MILGGMGTLGLTAVYLAVNGVLPEAFDATIVSPSMLHEWISREPLSRWEKFNLSLRADPFVYVLRPLIPFFLIGLIWGGKALIRPATSARTTLILWLVLTFALDFYLTNLTGRAYFHYYVTPTLALAALTLLELATLDRLKTQRRLYHLAWVAGCLYIAGVNVTYLNAFAERIDESEGALIGESIEDPLALYVEAHTLPEDTILVWGASSNIYFQSDRESATQYHYAYPLIVPEYTDPEQIAEVVADLESHRPVMIVDSAITDGDRVPPLNAYFRAIWWTNGGRRDTADLQPIYDFVTDHCLITEMIYGAVIFRCEYR
jgi:4-amino-4-deoxy-L-arabinose transferase-like glycosyltransferase